MSGSITKVAIAGATGNIGQFVLKHLLAANFSVTALTRSGSNNSFPESVTVKEVDYDSLDSLTAALQGQDAVVATLAGHVLPKQLLLIEAAAAAGVKRFLPSEFGSDTTNPKVTALPLHKPKLGVLNALKQKAAEGELSYTSVISGPFLEFGLEANFLLDFQNRHATLYDGGERLFSVSTMDDVGKSVVGVLQHPEETKNKEVFVQSTATSLKGLLETAKKVTKGGKEWTSEVVKVDDVLAEGWAELKKEKPDPAIFVGKFLAAVIAGEGYGNHFKREGLDNDLLGIKEMTEEEVEALIAKYVV
ncbi:hypothetical protein QBC35DRAFT_132047 [Podospora australis]|uniref:NmrA-like domain-containing protein n=1 Tax=Podospora australis TaxID=1536484 RepID=A0AAN7ADX3_9PEZI|nr:hypothetical protein QBC35DRAFT_132047 [Podospora australis]